MNAQTDSTFLRAFLMQLSLPKEEWGKKPWNLKWIDVIMGRNAALPSENCSWVLCCYFMCQNTATQFCTELPLFSWKYWNSHCWQCHSQGEIWNCRVTGRLMPASGCVKDSHLCWYCTVSADESFEAEHYSTVAWTGSHVLFEIQFRISCHCSTITGQNFKYHLWKFWSSQWRKQNCPVEKGCTEEQHVLPCIAYRMRYASFFHNDLFSFSR